MMPRVVTLSLRDITEDLSAMQWFSETVHTAMLYFAAVLSVVVW